MKKALVIFVIGFVLVCAWFIHRSTNGWPFQPVPASMIPPPVVVTLSRSNAPLRVFPGGGGVLLILPDNSLWQWGQTGPGNWGRSKLPNQIGTNCNWQQALAANNHSLAVSTNGTLWEWGWRSSNHFPVL
ncbi:MAG TPA: hypothetical protein VK731_04195, partial [Candidatus Cybelea sp.]|nr:hypothetical protein [Candidatus Cybelea sp.]